MKKLVGLFTFVFMVMCAFSCPLLAEGKRVRDVAKKAMREPLGGNIFTPDMVKTRSAWTVNDMAESGWSRGDLLTRVRESLYFRFMGESGGDAIFVAEAGRPFDFNQKWMKKEGLDDPDLHSEIRQWRKVMMTSARDFLNHHVNLLAVYKMAKPAILKAVKEKDRNGREIVQDTLDDMYALIQGTHPLTSFFEVSRAYKYSGGECFNHHTIGVSQLTDETAEDVCWKRWSSVLNTEFGGSFSYEEHVNGTGDIYEFFLRREAQGGQALLNAYADIIWDLSRSLYQ